MSKNVVFDLPCDHISFFVTAPIFKFVVVILPHISIFGKLTT